MLRYHLHSLPGVSPPLPDTVVMTYRSTAGVLVAAKWISTSCVKPTKCFFRRSLSPCPFLWCTFVTFLGR